ncbi:MAG: class I SAM-dependent methyltransferase, partial [Methanosarcinales archaeon]|nr:class I SAM-dependent methyltransferase [Methanosarcinales archaeon]
MPTRCTIPDVRRPKHYRDDCDRIAFMYDPLVRSLSAFIGGERGLETMRTSVINEMGVTPGKKVLDVCCGTGVMCAMIADVVGARGEVVGVDLSEKMLKKAEKRKKDNIRFCISNAEEIPYEDGYFDCASITFGLHEMPYQVRMNVLCEMRRVIKPGGKIAVLDYSYPTNKLIRYLFNIWMFVEGETAKDFVKRDLSSMIRDAGFNFIEKSVCSYNTVQIVSGVRC